METRDELRDFVKDALRGGASRADVTQVLAEAGWASRQVQATLAEFADVAFPVPVPRPRREVDARDAFLYLILFATLAISATNLGSLLFSFIDLWMPVPTGASSNIARYTTDSMHWSIAALVVAGPVFLLASRTAHRTVARDPAQRGSRVRRSLTYFTLTIASVVLIGDLITLVYAELSGEATPRFLLKVAVVALIAGGVFLYYRAQIAADEVHLT